MLSRLWQNAFVRWSIVADLVLIAAYLVSWGFGFTHDICQQPDPNGYQDCEPYNLVLFLLWKAEQFFNAVSPAITAFATVLLAVITYMLVHLGHEQSKTTKAQLRAYVAPVPRKAGLAKDGRTIIILVEVENTGQTPAFDTQVLGDITVMEYPLVGKLRLGRDPGEKGKPIPTYVVYPGGKHASAPRKFLTGEEIMKMDGGKHGLYVYGRATFTDAFGTSQWAEFCSVLDKPAFDDWMGQAKKAAAVDKRVPLLANFKFTEGNNRASMN